MVAWVVDAPARARLAAFTAGAWPGLPNLLASHHLQGLLRLDAGAAPGGTHPVRPSHKPVSHSHCAFPVVCCASSPAPDRSSFVLLASCC